MHGIVLFSSSLVGIIIVYVISYAVGHNKVIPWFKKRKERKAFRNRTNWMI